jgi:putative sigma-54 modulation protein
MNIIIQANGFIVDQKLKDLIELKLSKLTTYYEKIIDMDVKLSLDSHAKIKDKVMHVLCHIPNGRLFVESKAKSFEVALDNSVDDMKRQIQKKKNIQIYTNAMSSKYFEVSASNEVVDGS